AEGNNSPKYTSMRRPETVVQNAYSRADAVLAALPEPADRAAIYAEVAERLATDAEQGDKDGLTRTYRRSAAKQVREWADRLRRVADETATQSPPLVHVGWWCWRGGNHGHLAAMACRSDNGPIHVPAEWEDDMRAVIQRLEDEDDEPAAG